LQRLLLLLWIYEGALISAVTASLFYRVIQYTYQSGVVVVVVVVVGVVVVVVVIVVVIVVFVIVAIIKGF